ncbi:uncharacterized protein STEHIDRAFT_159445 [Stereum hirsutum FP-91666 SS1]|uniref:uncharacterized protein n=1 Tax=Stereum hirsutum (strain FP-91666) TaxID=721885 RepID=UPI0004449467|nr:uncharacterized protein STEHIDRAFT_159445 [Stereum hirsutum FP-91666 SS1]EIM83828.1 hypothetical protein STEHIDRAFT_159445 [Stereum hirsutum FP-91666 SS1]
MQEAITEERIGFNILDQLTEFKVSPDPEQDARLLILELSKLVVSTTDILLHPSGFWGLTMVQLPFCDHAGHSCDGFCHFADSIIKLLEKARSLVVDLPFPDVETLGVTWEALSLALTPPTEDTVKLFAGRN